MIPLPSTALLLKATPWLVAGLISGAWWANHDYQQREIGKRELLLAQSDSTGRALADSLRRLAPLVARIDTVVQTRIRTVTAQVATLRHDTTFLRDTVFLPGDTTRRIAVPVAEVDLARATIASCERLATDCSTQRELLGTQNRLLAADTLAKAHTITLVRGAVPSGLRTWGERLLSAGVGFGVCRAVR